MNRQMSIMAVALSCLCGAQAGNDPFYRDEVENWWEPDSNIVATHKAFESAHGLGEGETTRFFTRALETELARPGGGDSNTVALALDALAWSGDSSVTGILHKALFDTNNPHRVQTFYASVIAAGSNHTELTRDVTMRVPARERNAWYNRVIWNCPFYLCDVPFVLNPAISDPVSRQALIRANRRLLNYFVTATDHETDPECAWMLYLLAFKHPDYLDDDNKPRQIMYWFDIDVDMRPVWRFLPPWPVWEELEEKKKRLAERFADTPGWFGEKFSDEIEYEAYRIFEASFPGEKDKARAVPLLKASFAAQMRVKMPSGDEHALRAHHLRIRKTLGALQRFSGLDDFEMLEHIMSVPNENGYRLPFNWDPWRRMTYGLYDETLPPAEAVALLKKMFTDQVQSQTSSSGWDIPLEQNKMLIKILRALQDGEGFSDAEIAEFIQSVPGSNRYLIPYFWKTPQPETKKKKK